MMCFQLSFTFYCLDLLGALNPIGLSRLLPISIFCYNLTLCLWLLLHNLHLYDCILCNVLRLCCHCWLSCWIHGLYIFHSVFVLFHLHTSCHICCMSVDKLYFLIDRWNCLLCHMSQVLCLLFCLVVYDCMSYIWSFHRVGSSGWFCGF